MKSISVLEPQYKLSVAKMNLMEIGVEEFTAKAIDTDMPIVACTNYKADIRTVVEYAEANNQVVDVKHMIEEELDRVGFCRADVELLEDFPEYENMDEDSITVSFKGNPVEDYYMLQQDVDSMIGFLRDRGMLLFKDEENV